MQYDTDPLQNEILTHVEAILQLANRNKEAAWSPVASAYLEDAANTLLDLADGLRERIEQRMIDADIPDAHSLQ